MNKQNLTLDFEYYLNRHNINTQKLAEFLGWHVGDGCISINKNYYEYALTGDITEEYPFYNEVIVPSLNEIFKEQLREPVILKRYNSVGVCGVYIFSKKFVKMLQHNFNLKSGKKTEVGVPNIIKTKEQKRHFIRGLFDTDGSIYFCKSNYKAKNESLFNIFHYKPKIKLASISKILIKQVHKILTDLEIPSRIQKPIKQRKNEYHMHSIVLDTKEGTQKYIEEIGFQNIKHSTKVDIWRKFGFCPAYTTLKERIKILNNNMSPLNFYSYSKNLLLTSISKCLKQ